MPSIVTCVYIILDCIYIYIHIHNLQLIYLIHIISDAFIQCFIEWIILSCLPYAPIHIPYTFLPPCLTPPTHSLPHTSTPYLHRNIFESWSVLRCRISTRWFHLWWMDWNFSSATGSATTINAFCNDSQALYYKQLVLINTV